MPAAAHTSENPGTPMPSFRLPDVKSGREFGPEYFEGAKASLVVFLCRHCPYVVHMRGELVSIANAFENDGLKTLAISSNDAAKYPEDAPEKLREMAVECGFLFPLLYDASQETAKAFDAVCTPDIFLYDAGGRLYYRGRLDESTPGNGRPVTGADLRAAITSLLAGAPPPSAPQPSLGCSIKWR